MDFKKGRTRQKILIVDDDVLFTETVQTILESIYDTEVINDGQEALKRISQAQGNFHMILSDYRLGAVTGIDLFQVAAKTMPTCIRIIITGYCDLQAVVGAINSGKVYQYIRKPIQVKDLLVRVQRAFEDQALDESNQQMIDELQLLNQELENVVRERTRAIELELQTRMRTEHQLQQALENADRRRKDLIDSLNEAKETQESLLPSDPIESEHLEVRWRYQPAEFLAGDYFQVFDLGQHKWGFALADVTGHGVIAATITFVVHVLLGQRASSESSPAEVLSLTNGELFPRIDHDKFAAVTYGVYDAISGEFSVSNGGNPPLAVFRSHSDHIDWIQSHGPVLGAFDNSIVEFEQVTLTLQPGDQVVFFSDGLSEVMDEEGKLISNRSLLNGLSCLGGASLDGLLDQMLDYRRQLGGAEDLVDDITLLGFEVGKLAQ